MLKKWLSIICLSIITINAAAQTLKKQWKLFSPATYAKFVTWDWNNKMYIIDMNNELQESFSISGRGMRFTPALPGKKIKDINFAPDGSALALDMKDSLGYKRKAGKWETTQGMMAMTVITKEGTMCSLSMEGNLVKGGNKDMNGKYRYICAVADGDGLLSVKQGGETNYPGNPPKAKCIAADKSGVLGHIFLLSSGPDASLYYFDAINGKNVWTKLPSDKMMTFIAMDRKGVLYGVGTDNKVYVLAD